MSPEIAALEAAIAAPARRARASPGLLLDSGTLGLRDEVAPHISVLVDEGALHDAPGAAPAVGGSGTRLPRWLVRTTWCDSAVSRFVMSPGRKAIETSHTERTLTPHERRAEEVTRAGLDPVHRGDDRRRAGLDPLQQR